MRTSLIAPSVWLLVIIAAPPSEAFSQGRSSYQLEIQNRLEAAKRSMADWSNSRAAEAWRNRPSGSDAYRSRRIGAQDAHQARLGAASAGPQPTIAAGDRVVTVYNRTPVQRSTDILTTIPAGRELLVTEVRGPWAGVRVVQDGREILGWIHIAHLAGADSVPHRP